MATSFHYRVVPILSICYNSMVFLFRLGALGRVVPVGWVKVSRGIFAGCSNRDTATSYLSLCLHVHGARVRWSLRVLSSALLRLFHVVDLPSDSVHAVPRYPPFDQSDDECGTGFPVSSLNELAIIDVNLMGYTSYVSSLSVVRNVWCQFQGLFERFDVPVTRVSLTR